MISFQRTDPRFGNTDLCQLQLAQMAAYFCRVIITLSQTRITQTPST